jgi:hypothetical protein
LTVQTPHVGTSLAQAAAGKVAAPAAGRAAFGPRGQAAAGKAAAPAAERAVSGQRDSNDQEKAEKRKGPVVVEELVPLDAEHVAVLEPVDAEAGHAADQVLWEDAPESLPGADPEPVMLACVGQCMERDKVIPSPSVSSVGSTDRSLTNELEEACDREVESDPVHAGEYMMISVSGHRSARVERRDSPESCSSLEDSQAQMSFTGPNSLMQLVPRGLAHQNVHEQSPSEVRLEQASEVVAADTEKEKLELARVKSLCSSLLKAIAPPLLHEYEKTTGLRADTEPFTPKRLTRRSTAALAGTHVMMASAAESSLLKALGFCPENLAVDESDLRLFKEFFNSPVQDTHLRVMAAIFGKEIPKSLESEMHFRVAVPAQ